MYVCMYVCVYDYIADDHVDVSVGMPCMPKPLRPRGGRGPPQLIRPLCPVCLPCGFKQTHEFCSTTSTCSGHVPYACHTTTGSSGGGAGGPVEGPGDRLCGGVPVPGAVVRSCGAAVDAAEGSAHAPVADVLTVAHACGGHWPIAHGRDPRVLATSSHQPPVWTPVTVTRLVPGDGVGFWGIVEDDAGCWWGLPDSPHATGSGTSGIRRNQHRTGEFSTKPNKQTHGAVWVGVGKAVGAMAAA